jgi:dienelactone hydrolase
VRPVSPQLAGAADTVCIEEQRAELPSGKVGFDLYLPRTTEPAPLVVVAHGFARNKARMSGWGRSLASQGFAVAVPTLPALSDHRRNGRAINELSGVST